MSGEEWNPRILILEDKLECRQDFVRLLRDLKLVVEVVSSLDMALSKLRVQRYELVIHCKEGPWVESESSFDAPVLLITGSGQFDQMERVVKSAAEAVLKLQSRTLLPMDVLSHAELRLNADTREVHLLNRRLDLTRSEFHLLELFLQNPGKALSRDEIIERIQGEATHVSGRTVDTHVFGLRRKLGSYGRRIEAVRGIGYRLRSDTASN